MAKVPVIANTESNAGRRIESARTVKNSGRVNRGKDDSPEGGFANVLRRVRESGRSDSSEGTSLRKTVVSRRGIRGAGRTRESGSGRDGDPRISKEKTSNERLESKELLGSERTASQSPIKAAEDGRRSETGRRIPEKNALSGAAAETAEKASKAADTAVAAGLTAAGESGSGFRSDKAKDSPLRQTPAVGKLVNREQTVRPLVNRTSRVVVEDRRVAGEVVKGRMGRARTKEEGQSLRSEPSSNAQTEGNRFAVAETDITIESKSGGRSDPGHTTAELARKLDSQAGNEIVRQVKFVLNRADAGEVRINLRPENLGRVRVQIRMEENRLTGRIYVESAAAREAFRSTLDGLQAKLVESGFGAADLELAWDDGNSNFAQFRDSSGRRMKNSGDASREFEGMSTSVMQEGVSIGDGRVDMIV